MKEANHVHASTEFPFFILNKNKVTKLKYSKSHQNHSEFSRSNSKKLVLGPGQGSELGAGIEACFWQEKGPS